jgi:hypothetical protein
MGRRASDISWRVAGIRLAFLPELLIVDQWPQFLPEFSERPTALLTDSRTVILSRIEGWKGKKRGLRGQHGVVGDSRWFEVLLGR